MAERKSPAFNKMLSIIAPRVALSRQEAFNAYKVMNAYEGASRKKRLSGWHADDTSAMQETLRSLPLLRARSRDLVRNTSMAQKAVSAIQTSVVGTGIKPSCTNPEIDALVQEFALSTFTDFDGRLNLYGLQNLAMRTIVESGEVIIERIQTKTADTPKGLVPLRLRILEPDYLVDTLHTEDENIVQGIRFNENGQRTGYLLYDQHPGDLGHYSSQSYRMEPEEGIIHAYRVDRSGQLRGVPWAAPVIVKMRDYDAYEDAQLRRQQVAACFSTFITSPANAHRPSEQTNANAYELHGTQVQPGLILNLLPGEEVTAMQPPGVDGYVDFSTITLHQIAAGYGISYMSLTGDYSKVNFSSSRMAHIDEDRNINSWRDHILFSQVLERIGEWFLEAAKLRGIDTEGAKINWTAPVREMTNPKEEIEASVMLIRAGLSDLPTQQRKFGRNPEDIFENTVRSNEEIDRLGIRLDSDPRHTATAGAQVIDSGPQDNVQALEKSVLKMMDAQDEMFRAQGKTPVVSDEQYHRLLDRLDKLEGKHE